MGVIRTLLAVSVLVSHLGGMFGFHLIGGPMAVQSFYIVSGFYMAMILKEKYLVKDNTNYLFWSNRLLRLFPIYWIVLILSIILFFVGHNYFDKGWQLENYANYDLSISTLIYLFFSQIFILGQEFGMFLGLNDSGSFFLNFDPSNKLTLNKFMFIPPAWTIGIEIMFYLIAPFLVRLKSLYIFGLIFLSILVRILLVNSGLDYSPWDYRFFPTELVFFLCGIISYSYLKKVEHFNLKISYIAWITIIIYVLGFQFIPGDPLVKRILFYGLIVISLPFIFKAFKKSKLDRVIGELSYPIYISHMFIIYFARTFFMDQTKSVLFVPMLICLVILFSMLLIKYVSEPIEKIRQRRVSGLNQ